MGIIEMLDLKVWLAGLLIGLTLLYRAVRAKPSRLPPGPKPWPLVGNIIQLVRFKKPPFEVLSILRQKYGDVIYIKLGLRYGVVHFLGREKVYKAAVTMNEKFKHRPTTVYSLNSVYHGNGIIFSNGDTHDATRKLVLGSINSPGIGHVSLETKIMMEIEKFSEHIASHGGKPILYLKPFKSAVINIIVCILYGNRLEYDDPDLQTHVDQVDGFFEKLSLLLPENFIPCFRYLPGSRLRKLLKDFEKWDEYSKKRIQEHRENFDPDKPRDLVDVFLKQENTVSISERAMLRVITDLFNGSTDTTASALTWVIIQLVRNPDVQKKCREEILKVVINKRQIHLDDKDKLPYVQAFLREVLRYAAVAAHSIPHFTFEEVEFEDYIVPKNTIVFFSHYSLLMDKDVWGDPEQFRPERFLDKDGNLLKQDDKLKNYVPYGLGGRACLGPRLADMILFLFTANLIQKFEFQTPPGVDPPSDKRVQTGVTNQPEPYGVCAAPLVSDQ